MHIAADLTELIGNTPLLDLTKYQRTPLPATLLASWNGLILREALRTGWLWQC